MFNITEIISYLKKNFSRTDILFIIGLGLLYFVTRLINLKAFPIFSDEGIYINWAETAWRDASWRFISLTDGKQPLQTWGTIPFLKLFPNDALVAGRLFSVATGFTALVGMFTLCYYVLGKRAAYIGSLLYIFTPYFIFYDRMALVDSAVNAGFIWILFFSFLLAHTIRLDVALLFGVVAGFSLLSKSSSRMFIMLSAFAPLLFLEKNTKKFVHKSLNYFILLAGVLITALVMYNIQRLSPFFHYVAAKNNTFVMTFAEFFQNPFAVFFSNLQTIPTYVIWELGWTTAVFTVLGMYRLFQKDKRMFSYLILWLILPFIIIAFFAKVLFPRYLIFFGSLFLFFATYYFSTIKSKTAVILFSLLLATLIYFDYPLLFNPIKANFPPVDRGQYVEGLTAVWGADELVQHIRDESKDKPALVLAEGDFGLVADVLRVMVNVDDPIAVKGLWPLEEKELYEYQKDLMDKNVYIVFSHRTEFPAHFPMELIKKYPKPNSDRSLFLYRLLTTNEK